MIYINRDYDITLEMILRDLAGEKYKWRIFYLDASIRGKKSDLDMRSNELCGSEGAAITWSDLKSFSEDIIQLIDGIFIGSQSDDICLIGSNSARYKQYEYYIQLEDNYVWTQGAELFDS